LREQELDDYASRDLTEAARGAWAKEIDKERERLAVLTKRYLHREPQEFPRPIKGYRVTAEIDGLIFGFWENNNGENFLGLIVECPTCAEEKAYKVEGYADLGGMLANAAEDARCPTCIQFNRRV
jgi:hypothetical protein